ncbi:WD40 repeat domain-containing serine/threonine protein kinase [Ktedonospora formicarum]|uniref:non-specific serine/threonine protein kinase n=1 Tax=Ktedonospora formicarum TaxID=2778364 RepID=A0A8J3I2N5_9CHLR|nr:WD40 repeat domain-containing serine/threonine protein kinase [Ktedonospora formicarum]GHO46486.1 hypothetical protein KSX_46490 [Ktedonospora formicarum]
MEKQEILQSTDVKTLGRYQVGRRIGRGGMGEVWLCDDPRLGRKVAIKTLPVHGQQDQEFVQRFEQEARSAAALTHPHILEVHDYGKEELANGSLIPFLVMPYIQGSSLGSYLKERQGQISHKEALMFLKQAGEAIDYAHKRGIIHRDIKPDNMLLRSPQWLLLADFGIASMLTNDKHVSQGNFGFGTPEYIAPEQARGRAMITSDNYSLAVIAFQLFTGQLPFEGETALATIMQHLTLPPPMPRELNAELPNAFEQVLLQGLNKDPEKRPALASEFVQQLERTLSDPATTIQSMSTLSEHPELAFRKEVTPVTPEERKRGLSRRGLLLGSASGAAMLGGVTLGAWGYEHNIIGERLPDLPPPRALSARPSSTGSDKPTLVLTGGHQLPVQHLVWSPDSQTLLTSANDGYLFQWNIPDLLKRPDRPSGVPLYKTKSPPYFSGNITPLWSPDGKTIALVNSRWDERGIQVLLCQPDLRVIGEVWIPGNQNLLEGAAWISDTHLALLHLEGYTSVPLEPTTFTLYVVDVKAPQHLIAALTDKDEGMYGDLFASNQPTHPTLQVLARARSIEVGKFELAGKARWKPLAHLDVPPSDPDRVGSTVHGVYWASDSKHIVVHAEYQKGNTLFFYDWQAVSPRQQGLKLPEKGDDGKSFYIESLASSLSPTTPMLAVGGSAGEVYLCNLKADSLPVRKLDTLGSKSMINAVSWSPDGKWLAATLVDRELSILIWKL